MVRESRIHLHSQTFCARVGMVTFSACHYGCATNDLTGNLERPCIRRLHPCSPAGCAQRPGAAGRGPRTVRQEPCTAILVRLTARLACRCLMAAWLAVCSSSLAAPGWADSVRPELGQCLLQLAA